VIKILDKQYEAILQIIGDKHKYQTVINLAWQEDVLGLVRRRTWLGKKTHLALETVKQGHPAKSICLMVGLILLRHLRNISDESVVEQWQGEPATNILRAERIQHETTLQCFRTCLFSSSYWRRRGTLDSPGEYPVKLFLIEIPCNNFMVLTGYF
jgi:hypothetical protein